MNTYHIATVQHHPDGSKTIHLSAPSNVGAQALPAAYSLVNSCSRSKPYCVAGYDDAPYPASKCSSPNAYCCSSDGGRTCSNFPSPTIPSCPSGQQATYMPGFYCYL